MHTVEVTTTIDAVKPDEWDGLAASQPFAQHRWLRVAELVMAGYEPRYLLMRRGGRIVAAAFGTLERQLQNTMLNARFGWAARRWPFLHIAAPMTATLGVLVADGPDREADRTLLLRLLRVYIRRQRIPFCVIDHLPAEHLHGADRAGYRPLPWLPDTELAITASSFEQYLAELPRKKRQEINRIQRRAEREGIVVAPVTSIAEHGRTLDRLVENVVSHHQGIRHHNPDLFDLANSILGADLTVLAAHRDERVVGCVALLRDRDDVVVRWIGRDYERTEGTVTYHSLVAACVRHAIGMGARSLSFGAAAYETKKHFGVELTARHRLFTSRSDTVNTLMGHVGQRFKPPQAPGE